MAVPIYLDGIDTNPRSLDMSGVMSAYIVSHSAFADATSGTYGVDIDRTLMLTSLESTDLKIEVISLDMEDRANDNCMDSLTITTSDPVLPEICSATPATHTASFTSNEMSLRFQTNDVTNGDGFLIKLIGE